MFDLMIDPILIHLDFIKEGFGIRYYGLVYALGFLFAYFYLRYQAKQKRLNLTLEETDTFIIYAILGGIIGGRVGEFLFFQTDVLFSAPLEMFKIWQGGMSIHGGMIGFVIATLLFVKKHKKKVRFFEITDHIVIPASLALFFGRIANFTNAELCGRITNVPWAVNLNNPPACDGYRHPSQLYEALKNITMFIILLVNDKQQRLKNKYREGYATWLFLFMYGVLRIITNIWRDDAVWFFDILSTGQVLSLLMVLGAGYILVTKYWFPKTKSKKT
ncbi:prolipoprotein diacylglyceryl transferase [Candidatus Woesearchaeota archaeon]|nr:prolipoprotein diacylglyceryl transferase [Candidatus Woesearchaeota archaeon]